MTKKRKYIIAGIIIALGTLGAVIFFLSRPGSRSSEQSPVRATPIPASTTITTTSGQGTTATYEATESANTLTVTPNEVKPGERVTLAWSVPEAEQNSVRIEGVDGVFATEGSWQTSAPAGASGQHIYRLEARRKGGGEPIKLQVAITLKS